MILTACPVNSTSTISHIFLEFSPVPQRNGNDVITGMAAPIDDYFIFNPMRVRLHFSLVPFAGQSR
jgi:hypothetical protein